MDRKLSYVFTKKQILLFFLILAFAIYGAAAYLSQFSAFLPVSAAVADEGVRLPIIMYHSILDDKSRAGKYVATVDTFRSDLKFLSDRGYNTVVVSDLVSYAGGYGDLPENPVMITLDDGFLNNLTLALPVLEEFNYSAVVSVVGAYTDHYTQEPDPNPYYAYLTWEDIRTLQESGRVEIQNHSYDMHSLNARKGCSQMAGETSAQYKDALRTDLQLLQERLSEFCGVTPIAFTPPYGVESDGTMDIVKSLGFSAILTCNEKVNTITRDPECLYSLGRFNRSGGLSTAEFMKRLGIT